MIYAAMCVCVAGIRSWDTNLLDCNLDQELKLFVSRHSARFSADVKGKLEIKDNCANNFTPPDSFDAQMGDRLNGGGEIATPTPCCDGEPMAQLEAFCWHYLDLFVLLDGSIEQISTKLFWVMMNDFCLDESGHLQDSSPIHTAQAV